MENGPQTVPVSLFDSDIIQSSLSSYVPDFDVFLRDSEVPSPSNIYYNTLFADSPDYSMLTNNNNNNDSYCYQSVTSPNSPEYIKQQQQQQQLHEHNNKMQALHQEKKYKKEKEDDDEKYNNRSADPFADEYTTALYDSAESTHLDLFAATFVHGVNIKKEVLDDDDGYATNDCGHMAVGGGGSFKCAPPPSNGGGVTIKSELMEDEDDSVICEDFEKVQSLVMQHLTATIEVACDALHISPDPTRWSVENVHSWLLWTSRQYDLPHVPLDYFIMDGAALCSLTEDNFRQLTSQYGDILYAQLEIWKTAASFKREQLQQQQQQQQQHPPTSLSGSLAPNVPMMMMATNNNNNVAFKAEDSMLDISSYFQWTSSAVPSPPPPPPPAAAAAALQPHILRERSVSPDHGRVACVPDIGSSASHSSDYASSDDDTSEDGLDGDKTLGASLSGVGGGGGGSRPTSHAHIHLWQFLKELLMHPQPYSTCIRWLDRSKGVFKIEDSVRVAKLWGKRKNRPAMNYDKLSRSIRQYYKKGIMKKTERSQRLVYQFCHPYCL